MADSVASPHPPAIRTGPQTRRESYGSPCAHLSAVGVGGRGDRVAVSLVP